jgi:hypothetical protein
MLQIKDYRRDVNDVGLAGPPTENSWFRHCIYTLPENQYSPVVHYQYLANSIAPAYIYIYTSSVPIKQVIKDSDMASKVQF